MNNYIVARNYLKNPQGYYKKNYLSVGYSDGVFYSYSTAIAEIAKDIKGDNVLIVSDDTMSNTTGRHINTLLDARGDIQVTGITGAPIKVYRLPQQWGEKKFNSDWCFNKLTARLASMRHKNEHYYWVKECKLTRTENRQKFIKYYHMLRDATELEMFKKYREHIYKVLSEYESLYDYCAEMEHKRTARWQAKQAQAIKEKDK